MRLHNRDFTAMKEIAASSNDLSLNENICTIRSSKVKVLDTPFFEWTQLNVPGTIAPFQNLLMHTPRLLLQISDTEHEIRERESVIAD